MGSNIKFRENFTDKLFARMDDSLHAWTNHNEQQARAITEDCLQMVTPYEAFLIGLAFSTGAKIIATDFFYKSSAVFRETNGWTVFLVDKSRNTDAFYPTKRILPLAELWLNHAAEEGESCAMAYLAYLHEYNRLDYLTRADILSLLNEYLPRLHGSYSVYPNVDRKMCDFILSILRNNSAFSGMEMGKLLDQRKVLGVFSSKVNWSMPKLLMIFTDKYVVSNLFHEETAPGAIPKLVPYMEYGKIDAVDTVPFAVNGDLYEAVRFRFRGGAPAAGYLAYNPKRLDGHSLRALFEKMVPQKEDHDFNLRVVSMLRGENKYGVDYDPLLTNENINAFLNKY